MRIPHRTKKQNKHTTWKSDEDLEAIRQSNDGADRFSLISIDSESFP